MHRSLLVSLLAFGSFFALTTPAAPAAACGGYGQVSEETKAAAPVWRLLQARDVDEHVRSLRVALNGDRGRATVHFDGDRRLVVNVVRQGGQWRIAS